MSSFQYSSPKGTIPPKNTTKLPNIHISSGSSLSDAKTKFEVKSLSKVAESLTASTSVSTNSISSLEKPTINLSWDRKVGPSNPVFNQTMMAKNTLMKPATLPRLGGRKRTFRLKGILEVYQENWFDIQSKSLNPLFMEMPTPCRIIPGSPKFQKAPVITQSQVRPSRPRARKVINLDMYVRTCDACNTKKKKGVQLRCFHYVCKDCLQSHIKKQIELQKVPIKCPKGGCKYQLDHQDINKHAPNTELVKRHYELCVSSYVEKHPHQLVQCYTQGCGYVINLGKLKTKDQLDCPRCKKVYCIRCHKLSHGTRPCDESM